MLLHVGECLWTLSANVKCILRVGRGMFMLLIDEILSWPINLDRLMVAIFSND
jgi:hypothetical protein